jgi:hypothetical protein
MEVDAVTTNEGLSSTQAEHHDALEVVVKDRFQQE